MTVDGGNVRLSKQAKNGNDTRERPSTSRSLITKYVHGRTQKRIIDRNRASYNHALRERLLGDISNKTFIAFAFPRTRRYHDAMQIY